MEASHESYADAQLSDEAREEARDEARIEAQNREGDHQRIFPRPAALLVLAAILAIAIVIIYAAQAVLLVYGGVLFGIFLRHLSMNLDQYLPMKYSACLTLVVVLLVTIFLGVGIYAGPNLVQQLSDLSDELRNAYESLLQRYDIPFAEAPGTLWRRAISGANVMGALSTLFSAGIAAIVAGLVIFFTGVYFAADTERYREGIIQFVPADHRLKAARAIDSVDNCLWSWLLGRIASMTIIGVGTWIVLLILGIPLALPLALITALLTFIPNIGPVLSVIPPALLAFEQGWTTVALVVVFYLLLQIVESYIITPLIIQHAAKVPPVIGISAQLILGMLVGLVGVMFAVPLVVATRVLLHEFYLDHQEGVTPHSACAD